MRPHLRPHVLKLRSTSACLNVFPLARSRTFSVLTIHSQRVSSLHLAASSQGNVNNEKPIEFAANRVRDDGTISRPADEQESSLVRKEHHKDDVEFQQRVRARRHAKLELRYLGRDDEIHSRLKRLLQTDPQKAEAMVKLLSRQPNEAVAAWNILIDDALKSDPPKVNLAFKLYNQMKKSQQEPDEVTMRTVLNGIGNNLPIAPNVPEKCLGLYNYWLSGRSASLKKNPPVTKDYNRLLSIIVTGKKWETMWQLITDAPETGPRMPDSATYGIVLQGIEGQMLEAEKRMKEEHIISALRVWRAILDGCRTGKIGMDSPLVTKMGNLLVQSTDLRCRDAVFDLVKLTTGIPRYDESKDSDVPVGDSPSPTSQRWSTSEPDSLEALLAHCFRDPGPVARKLKVKPSIYILNFVLDACALLHRKNAAMHYYFSFQAAGVPADRVNLNGYLRVLRETRSAKEAAEAVEKYVEQVDLESENAQNQKPTWGTFRIAMSACGRQRKDPGSAIRYATQIYDLRRRVFPNDLDMQVLDNYLICIDLAASQIDKTEALRRVAEDLAKSIKSVGNRTKSAPELEVVKKVIGLIDKQENSGEASRDIFESWKPMLSSYVFMKEKARKDKTEMQGGH